MEIFEHLFKVGLKLEKLNKILISRSELSLIQWYILREMINNPYCSANKLADRIGCHSSTLTSFLSRMNKKKFVIIDTDASDGRRKRLVITRLGKEKVLKTEKFLKETQTNLNIENIDLVLDSLIERLRNV